MTAPTPRLVPTVIDERPVRVLYLIDHLAAGGAEQVLLRYLAHLHLSGVEATVVAVQVRDGNPVADDIRALGIPVETLGIERLRQRDASRLVRDAIARHHPEVVHTQLEFSNILGTIAARRLGIPTIATLHTLDAPAPWSRDRLRFRLMAAVLRNRADRVVAVSESARAHHLRVGRLRPAATITLHNGIDLDPFRSPPPDSRDRVRAAFDIPSDSPVVTTVAVHREPKGIDHLLAGLPVVLEHHPAARYLLVGDGPHRAALEQHVRELGLDHRVHFTGHRSDIPALLAASDVFALPSLTEALPTVLAEAMAAGLPIVATTVGGIPEMVDHGVNGLLVPPADPGALSGAVIRMLDNPVQTAAMGRAGERIARERFDITTRAAELLDEYRHLRARGSAA